MKRSLLIIILTLILFSCSQDREKGGETWKPVDREFDSIASALDACFYELKPDTSIEKLLGELTAVASKHPNNRQIQARTHYWQGRVMRKLDMTEGVDDHLKLARLMTDSAVYHYDLMRINFEVSKSFESAVDQYVAFRESADYFKYAGDMIMEGDAYLNLGYLFVDLLDTVSSLHYYKAADSVFLRSHADRLRILNLLNLTIFQPDEKKDSLLNIIRSQPWVKSVQSLYYPTLYNSYLFTGKREYLDTLYACIKGAPGHEAGVSHVEALLANDLLSNKVHTDSAIRLARRAWLALRDDYPLITQSIARRYMSEALKLEGKNDSAFRMLNESNEIYKEVLKKRHSSEVTAHNTNKAIEEARLKYEMERESDKKWFWGIIAAILVVAIAVGTWAYVKWKRACSLREQSSKELEKERMELAASKIVMHTKDEALKNVADKIDDMKAQGKVSHVDATELSTSLKVLLSGKDELESFQEIYSKLNPDFQSNLKKRHPDLSEGQLKLAVYIAIGMTTQQISKMLAIDHSSVNKNRYRLRSKLGLERSDSLEDYLRSMGER